MADEITAQVRLTFSKGGISLSRGPNSFNVDVSGSDAIHATQNIDTTAENIAKGDITTPGYMWVKNLDSTNFVEIGYDDTGFKNLIKLKAGEEALFRLTQTTPQAKADTAAVDIEYMIIED
jgi:hypothetical protein